MKKISLKNLNLKEVEQLSKEQLKDVLGGSAYVTIECKCPNGQSHIIACKTTIECANTCINICNAS